MSVFEKAVQYCDKQALDMEAIKCYASDRKELMRKHRDEMRELERQLA